MKTMLHSKFLKPMCKHCLSESLIKKCKFGTKGQSLVENLCKKPGPSIPEPSPNTQYLLNKIHKQSIVENLCNRTAIPHDKGSILVEKLYKSKEELKTSPSDENRKNLNAIASQFPNLTHPAVAELKEPKVLKEIKWEPKSPLRVIHPFEKLGTMTGCLRTHDTGQVASERSYYLFGQFAELEQALTRYTIDYLVNNKEFELVSVPDLLHPDIIRACGMDVDGERTQVFKLDTEKFGKVALSGTAEMAFGGLFMNKNIDFGQSKKVDKYKRVKRYCAVSRCYRAESSRGQQERGIYRVHNFTKVEMFGLMPGDTELSNLALEQLLDIQMGLFDGLGLSYRVLDMPAYELGNPAYRKYDIEALLPGRNAKKGNSSENSESETNKASEDFYGEISSCSNCTDYQSRRLNIKDSEMGQFCHTVNGTACAVPRMIMTICEQYQTMHGSVLIPDKLKKYMRNETEIKAKDKKSSPVFKYMPSSKKIISKLREQDLKSKNETS